jgi:hypothetical protein
MTGLAEAIREIGVAGCSSWQCGSLEEACAIQAEQLFLSTAQVRVRELGSER